VITIDTDSTNYGAKIRVIGVGGGGGNAINSMIQRGLTGVDSLLPIQMRKHFQRILQEQNFILAKSQQEVLVPAVDQRLEKKQLKKTQTT